MTQELRFEQRADTGSEAQMVSDLLQRSLPGFEGVSVRAVPAPSSRTSRSHSGSDLLIEIDGVSLAATVRTHRRPFASTHVHLSVSAPPDLKPTQPSLSISATERGTLSPADARGVLVALGLAYESAGSNESTRHRSATELAAYDALEQWRSEALNGVVSDIIDPGARELASTTLLELERHLPSIVGRYARVVSIDEVRCDIVKFVSAEVAIGDKRLKAEYVSAPNIQPTVVITSVDGTRRSANYSISSGEAHKSSSGRDAKTLLS
jgi:hypothetical protein